MICIGATKKAHRRVVGQSEFPEFFARYFPRFIAPFSMARRWKRESRIMCGNWKK